MVSFMSATRAEKLRAGEEGIRITACYRLISDITNVYTEAKTQNPKPGEEGTPRQLAERDMKQLIADTIGLDVSSINKRSIGDIINLHKETLLPVLENIARDVTPNTLLALEDEEGVSFLERSTAPRDALRR